MTNPETRIPGTAMEDWQLFERKVRIVDGRQKTVWFKSPDGKYYDLGEGEELIHNEKADGPGRDTFIRKDGQEIPFEEWKRGKK